MTLHVFESACYLDFGTLACFCQATGHFLCLKAVYGDLNNNKVNISENESSIVCYFLYFVVFVPLMAKLKREQHPWSGVGCLAGLYSTGCIVCPKNSADGGTHYRFEDIILGKFI